MVQFYESNNQDIPPLPSRFTYTTLNPASSGGRGNLQILQLMTTYRYFYINVVSVFVLVSFTYITLNPIVMII